MSRTFSTASIIETHFDAKIAKVLRIHVIVAGTASQGELVDGA